MAKVSNLATRRNAQKRAIAKAELPPNPMMLTWELDKRPTDEWIAEHGEDFPDLPADEDMTVGVNLYAVMAFPAVGVLPANWKRGRSLLCTFQEMPYHQLEAFCREDAGLPAKPLKGAPEATDPGPCKFRLGKCIRHTDCQPPPAPPDGEPPEAPTPLRYDPTRNRCTTCGQEEADHAEATLCREYVPPPEAA